MARAGAPLCVAEQVNKSITGGEGACLGAGLTWPATPVHLSGGNSGETDMHAFTAPDRPISIPDARRRAGEDLAIGNDGGGKQECEQHRGDAIREARACHGYAISQTGGAGVTAEQKSAGSWGLAGGSTRSQSGAILGPAGLLRSTRKGVRSLRYGFLGCAKKVIAAAGRTRRAPVERDGPAGAQRSPDMFTDIATARRHAFSLSRSLMVVTFVIAIGQQYGVITAEDADGSVALVAEFDPFS